MIRLVSRLISDLVPRETLQAWIDQLPLTTLLYSASAAPTPAAPSAVPVSKTKTSAPPTAPVLGRQQFLAYLASLAAEKAKSPSSSDSPAELTVALMGLPNVGKTSVLNSLLAASGKKYATAATVPTIAGSKHPEPTTKRPTEVSVDVQGSSVKIIDTPGWEYADDNDEMDDDEEEEDEDEAKEDVEGQVEAEEMSEEKMKKWDEMEAKVSGDLLRRNLGRVDRVKNPVPLGELDPTLRIAWGSKADGKPTTS